MRMYPNLTVFPHTPADFFVHIKTKKQDERFEIAYAFTSALPTEKLFSAITITEVVGFSFQVGSNGMGRDLGGFEDGTENLKPEARREAVLTEAQTSFLLTQLWVHNLRNWNRHAVDAQEKMIGRTKKESTELNPLPLGSHVERTENNPMFRQSMPYGDSNANGLFFVAYVKDLHTFHHTLRMMGGAYNNVHDKIIGNLSIAKTGAYWYVPNVASLRQWAN
jgi:putative iron-dependent peroxidase